MNRFNVTESIGKGCICVASVVARGTKVVTNTGDAEQKLEKNYRSLGAPKAVAQPGWAEKVRKHLGDIANAKER